MVLPIQSQLAHTSNTVGVISLGLTNLSQMITGLGPLLSGAFSAGLAAFQTLEKAASGWFESQIKGLESLLGVAKDKIFGGETSPTSDPLSGGSGPKSDKRLMDEALARAAALGSGGPTNPMLFDQRPIDPGAGIFGMFGRGGVQDTRSDRVKMAEAMSGGTTNITVNVEASGITDSTDKTKLAADLGNIYADEILRRGGLYKKSGRLQ